MRPEGYATNYSYFAEQEAYADVAAYIIMDATYAAGDRCIDWRLVYVRNLFRKIKEGRLKVVDQQKYIKRHVYGQ